MAASCRNLRPTSPVKAFVISTPRSPAPRWPDSTPRSQELPPFLLPSAVQPAHCPHGHKVATEAPPPLTGPGEKEEPFGPLFKTRQHFLSHLIGPDRVTCPPLHQPLAKETRLTVTGLDDSGGGLFPEPMDAQMRGDTRRPGPSPARKKRDQRKKRCGAATPLTVPSVWGPASVSLLVPLWVVLRGGHRQ